MKTFRLNQISLVASMLTLVTVGCGELTGKSDNSPTILTEGGACDISSPNYDSAQCVAEPPGSSTNSNTQTPPGSGTNTNTPPSVGSGNNVTGCPKGAMCLERPWPVFPQEIITMSATKTLAIKIITSNAGVTGHLNTMYTPGNTATRQWSISPVAGDFTGNGNSRCVGTGFEFTSASWAQVETATNARGVCEIPANSVMWVNIRFTNCESGTSCRFWVLSTTP